nr:MAG TPA: NADAR protein [Caudoviricetes sp.]
MSGNIMDSFKGQYSFLSNFYPVQVEIEGIVYPSVEHAYVAMKTMDIELRKQISLMETAGKVKRMGRTLNIRSDWDHIKLPVMFGLLRLKFQKPELKLLLISTGDSHLEEGNWWGDTFWGVCKGVGENNLGKLLMRVRQEIIQ